MSEKSTTDRRSFLKLASIGSASAAIAAVSTGSADAVVYAGVYHLQFTGYLTEQLPG